MSALVASDGPTASLRARDFPEQPWGTAPLVENPNAIDRWFQERLNDPTGETLGVLRAYLSGGIRFGDQDARPSLMACLRETGCMGLAWRLGLIDVDRAIERFPEGFVDLLDSIDTSGDGEICVAELQVAIRTVDPKADDKTVERMLSFADADGDDTVSFAEFKEIIRASLAPKR